MLFGFDLSKIVYHHSGKWTSKETIRDGPINADEELAQVANDKMYVLDYDSTMHALNLHSWTWTTISPRGNIHSGWTTAMSSWVYKGKIYYASLMDEPRGINVLLCYNVSGNCWESTWSYGAIPSFPTLQDDAKVIISDDTVFLLGGYLWKTCIDLYTLDMTTMRWTRVHGNTLLWPKMVDYSFTLVSKSTAVMYGSGKANISECWVLNLENAKQLKEPAAIWTKIPNHFPRSWHTAVLEPVSKSLWVMGGYEQAGMIRPPTLAVLTMSFKLHSLQELAMNHILNHVKSNDPRLGPMQLPRQLRNHIEDLRGNIKRGRLCTLGEGNGECLCKIVVQDLDGN